MHTTRRDFVRLAAVAGLGLSPLSRWAAAGLPSSGKSILILGGTGFLGPACSEAALARGHKVTLFNRGRSESMRKDRGRPSAVPAEVEEVLIGNRDPDKTADEWKKPEERDANSPKGLSQLEGRKWDAVIDTSGYWPRIVKASAELLAPNVGQYVFISTISVYKDNSKPNMAEDGELNTLSDPKTEDFGAQFENYGAGKAACEAAAEAAMPGRVTNIRPGFIVGPRDTSRRFLYWPIRARRGGEVLLPGAPDDPIQIIDVRDLAEWIVLCIERKTTGVFNATGPDKELSVRAMIEGCKRGVGGKAATYTWADASFLEREGVRPGELPLWAAPTGETAGFHRINIDAAKRAGLTFRSVEDTARATIEWFDSLPADVQVQVSQTPMTPEREDKILQAWKKTKVEPPR
ncbi:MAG: NAD-dependent epimerase/dehydratase family protein [Phycisphaeraceae bacterium]|nr:NAD-dependent epimerase/dehydratase family protein [Phycisphaeraceae bacterium]